MLATNLRDSGVNVILDKWDLKEGNDANDFMESMVKNPEIGKVLVICDKVYAKNADLRKGGVGTEAQIISSELYDKTDAASLHWETPRLCRGGSQSLTITGVHHGDSES